MNYVCDSAFHLLHVQRVRDIRYLDDSGRNMPRRGVLAQSLYNLTQVFEKARYSKHEISSDDKDKAIKCLSEIITAPVLNPVEGLGNEPPGEGINR